MNGQQQHHKTIFTFLGAPGSGKGTLAEMCATRLGFTVLSTGNLCREAITRDDEEGKQIKNMIDSGKLIPDTMIVDMVGAWIKNHQDHASNIIFDGFPRTKPQAEAFLALLKEKFSDYAFRVVLMDVSHETIIKRLSARLVCSNKTCQKVYTSLDTSAPTPNVCASCNSQLIRRQDDEPEVIAKRLAVYTQHEQALLDLYATTGQNMYRIAGDTLTREQAFEEFTKAL